MKYTLHIDVSPLQNGYQIKVASDGQEKEGAQEWVVQRRDDERAEVEAWRDALFEILEAYGPRRDRYSAHRLYLVIAPGDNHPTFTNELIRWE